MGSPPAVGAPELIGAGLMIPDARGCGPPTPAFVVTGPSARGTGVFSNIGKSIHSTIRRWAKVGLPILTGAPNELNAVCFFKH